MKHYDKLIFELSRPGRKGYQLPEDKFGVDGEEIHPRKFDEAV